MFLSIKGISILIVFWIDRIEITQKSAFDKVLIAGDLDWVDGPVFDALERHGLLL